MKKSFRFLALSSLGLTIPLMAAQSQSSRRVAARPTAKPTVKSTRKATTAVLPASKTLRGEAFFLERIALPPRAMLHVSLVGRVAGAEDLPLATTVVPAKNALTPFKLSLPTALPAGPFRLQAWIIGDNRALFESRDTHTPVTLEKLAKIGLKIVPAPQNIDGIGDGQPLSVAPNPSELQQGNATSPASAAPSNAPLPMTQSPAAPQAHVLRGKVVKLDRRALSPDARLEIQLRDVSFADGPSPLILGQNIQLDGQQLPKSFEMALLPTDLQPRHRYALSARVYEAGKLSFITNALTEVSPNTLEKPFELRVVSAAPAP